jgi:hypothetical protein
LAINNGLGAWVGVGIERFTEGKGIISIGFMFGYNILVIVGRLLSLPINNRRTIIRRRI